MSEKVIRIQIRQKLGLLRSLTFFTFLALIFTSSAQAACPNEAIRASQASETLPSGTTGFPACMALEMVTPAKKYGQETLSVSAFSTDGSRSLFVSKAALANTPGLLSFGGDSYVALRTDGGWETAPTSPPGSTGITAGGFLQGGPYAFDPALGGWLSFGATQSQTYGGKGQLFSGDLDGGFGQLSPVLAPIDDKSPEVEAVSAFFFNAGSAADLSTTVFSPGREATAYLSQDPREIEGGGRNTYLAFLDTQDGPSVQLLARDASGKVWGGRCGSRLGGGAGAIAGGLNQGAISPDGSRIFFSTRPAQPFDKAKVGHPEENVACNTSNPLRVMVRTGEGPQIEELLPGGPSEAGDDLFQAASRDGSKALIASPRKLAASDTDVTAEACSSTVGSSKGCDLYLYDEGLPLGSRLIQLSAGENVPGKHEAGKEANVLTSIAGASPDGSHAYFAAQGVLTADTNPEGKSAQLGKPNLYLYERDAAHPAGELSFIGTLAEADKGKAWGGLPLASGSPYPVPLLGGPEGGDGHVLFFLSKALLTSEDNDTFVDEEGKAREYADVYRYDSSDDSLVCVSCAPGGPDSQPFDAFAGSAQKSTGSNFAELGRWASEDGQTVAFATAAKLTPEDEDADVNSYLWREGQLQRLPGAIVGEASYYKLPTVSPEGQQVGFTTAKALLPVDGDSTRDAYVARVDGGFPNPAPTTACDPLSEGACQGPPSSAPAVSGPATPSFSGPGNPTPVTCKKAQVKKRGKCVSRKHKQKKRRRASHHRGGGK